MQKLISVTVHKKHMKRGRPSKRADVRPAILKTLEGSAIPLTASALGRLVSEQLGTHISWNTIQKYVRELVETNKVRAIPLLHSKRAGETGLVVYTVKK